MKKTHLGLAVLLMVALTVLSGASFSQFLSVAAAQSATPTPAAVATSVIVPSAADASMTEAFQGTLEQVYREVNPSGVSVVVIETVSTPSFLGTGQESQTVLGSGFVWGEEGHIVTSSRVVYGADQINVRFAGGTIASAGVIGTDLNSDLAVLKVDLPAAALQPVQLADSTQVQVGQPAIAIGNPFGEEGTMTMGIVSALGRTLPVQSNTSQSSATYSIPDVIQADALINPGNSGGVLVDDSGRVIGVTAANWASMG